MVKAKAGLKRKPIKRSKALGRAKVKKTSKRLPLSKKTATELVKVADKEFSRYVRLRDCEYIDGQWIGECIDECGKKIVVLDKDGKWNKAGNIGHYITRGVHQLRFDELNCNLQSAYCNAWRDKQDMLSGYERGLDLKYGAGTAKELVKLSKQEGAHKMLTKPELLEIIKDSKTYIQYTLDNKG